MKPDYLRRQFAAGMALSAAGILLPNASFAKTLRSSKKRKLALLNVHTDEDLEVTYWKNGRYQERAISKLNELLRDHRSEQVAAMDIKIIDQLFAIQKSLRSNEQIKIISAFRSHASNEELRQRSRGVAKKSYHTLGRALDIFIPDASLSRQRRAALRLSAGGVGYYRRSQFIHIDSGPVRTW